MTPKGPAARGGSARRRDGAQDLTEACDVEARLAIRLESDDPISLTTHGPLFHRWIPDGEVDAIELAAPKGNLVKVWFERRGHTVDNRIVFNIAKRDVDVALMDRHGVLEAGPVFCSVEFTTARAEAQNDEVIARRVLGVALPSLGGFVDRLRLEHGQHWLPEVPDRNRLLESMNLSGACQFLELKRRINRRAWKELRPSGAPTLNINAQMPSDDAYRLFLTRDKWRELVAARPLKPLQEDEADVLAVCARALRELELGHGRAAIADATTAAEVALQAAKRSAPPETKAALDRIDAEPHRLAQRVAASAGVVGDIAAGDVRAAFRAIELRNAILHSNAPLPPLEEIAPLVRSVVRVASRLARGREVPIVERLGHALQDWDG